MVKTGTVAHPTPRRAADAAAPRPSLTTDMKVDFVILNT